MDLQSKSIAIELREIRTELGLTQTEFAEEFNSTEPLYITTTRADVSRYELGITDPPASKYVKFLAMRRKKSSL